MTDAVRTGTALGRVIVGGLVLPLAAGSALAQEGGEGSSPPPESLVEALVADDAPAEPDPGGDPALRNPGVEEVSRDLEAPASGRRVYRAVGFGEEGGPLSAAEGLADLRPGSPELVREGSFLVRRRGILVPVSEGRWGYVFDEDAEGDAEPPMLLQPSLRLAEMVRLARSRSETVTFEVSGQVFVYRGRNYLLPQSFATFSHDRQASAAEADAEGSGSGDESERERRSARRADAVDELLRAVDEADGSPGRLVRGERVGGEGRLAPERGGDVAAATVGGGGGGEGRAFSDLIREGSMIVSRRGRLVRGVGALWTFVSDNDVRPDAADPADQEAGGENGRGSGGGSGGESGGGEPEVLTLMPSLAVEEMERLASHHGDRVTFVVSGLVYVFEGRNYLLPTMFYVEPSGSGDVVSAQ